MHATERRQKLTQKQHHNKNNVWDAQGNKGMTRERKREETEQSVYENWEDQETRGNSRNRQAGIKVAFTKNKADHDVSCGILDVVGAVAVGDTAKSPCSGTSERLHAGAGLENNLNNNSFCNETLPHCAKWPPCGTACQPPQAQAYAWHGKERQRRL